MSSPRPILVDAVAARNLLPARPQRHMWKATRPRSGLVSKMELDETILSSAEHRLPSTRPLDRRWDRSRGIIFSNALRPALHDHTWSREHGVIFAEIPASQRGYASRPMGPAKKSAQQSPPQPLGNRNADVLNNPNWSTGMKSDHPLRDLERERKAREEERKAHEKRLQEVKDASQRQILAIKEELGKRENALKTELQELERRRQEYARQASDRDSKASERDRALQERKRDSEAKEARLAVSIANADGVAKNREATFIQRVQHRTAQADADVARYRTEYHDKMERLDSRQAEQLRDHTSRLEQDMNRAHTSEMRIIKAARLDRQAERATYDEYHAVWDNVVNPARVLSTEFSLLGRQLKVTAVHAGHVSKSFDGEKIHPWFPHKYATLNTRLQEFLQTTSRTAADTAAGLNKLFFSYGDERNKLSRLAHDSRALTRHHKHELVFTKYATVHLASMILNEEPIRSRQASIDEMILKTKKELEHATDTSTKDALQQVLQSAKKERVAISTLLSFFIRLRGLEALKALRRDTFAAKELFFIVQEPKARLEEARDQWDDFKEKYPAPERNESEGVNRQLREQFVEDFAKVRSHLKEVESLVRKRRLLQTHLGIKNEDEDKYDAEIERRITEGSSTADKALEMLVSGGIGRIRQPVASKSPATPAFKRTTISGTAPSATTPVRRRKLERNDQKVVVIRKQLSGREPSPSEEREDTGQGSSKSLTIEDKHTRARELARKRILLNELEETRAELLQNSPKDVAQAAELEKQIRAAKDSISTILIANTSSQFPKGSPKAKPETSPRTSRPRPTRSERRARNKAASKAAARDESDAGSPVPEASSARHKKEGPTVGRMVFRPSLVSQASRPYWPVSSRYFHVEKQKAENSPQASARPSLPDDFYTASFSEMFSLTQALRNASLSSAGEKGKAKHVQARRRSSSDSFDDHKLFDAISESDQNYEPSQAGTESEQAFENPTLSDQSSEAQPPTSRLPNMPQSHLSAESVAPNASIESGTDFQATYKISPSDYRDAVMASKSTTAAFWSHKLYKNNDGRHPVVYYCTSYEQAEAQAKRFLEEEVIGFDIEWEPSASYSKSKKIKDHVSLVQIAAEDKIALFHVALFTGDTAEKLMPPSLRAVLESKTIAKVGVNISGDATRVRNNLEVEMKGLFELSRLYNVVEYSKTAPSKVNKRLVALDKQVMAMLGLPLKKEDHVRQSAWARKLRVEQSDYAASDAYAGYQLYRALEAKRMKMDPMPPRPAFYEDGQPLQLGDGTIIHPKPFVPRKKRGAVGADGKTVEVEDESEDEDENFDAVEDLEEDEGVFSQGSSAGGGLLLTGIDVSYPSLPQTQDLQQLNGNEQQETTPAESSPTAATNKDTQSSKKRERPPSTEFDLADTWATRWRAENGAKLKPQDLRAYQLWHAQSFDCKAVARLLASPPLSLYTVAQYLMNAIEGGLPFDAERVREPLEILPKSVHRRYWKVLKKIEEVAV